MLFGTNRLWNKKAWSFLIASLGLLLIYQNCSESDFQARRLVLLRKQGVIFNMENRSFPACSGERTMTFVYTASAQETFSCFDNTRLAPGLTQGAVCDAGPQIRPIFTNSNQAQNCSQTTLCGVKPSVSQSNTGGSSSIKTYRLTYQGLPLGCTGTLRIEDRNKKLVQEIDIETPGSEKVLCRKCSNNHYSCSCDPVGGGNNGVCGQAHNASFAAPPDRDLCSSGTPSAIGRNGGLFEWTCFASAGGTNDLCKAFNSSYLGGTCGSDHQAKFTAPPSANLCSQGKATIVRDNGTTYIWECDGEGGAGRASCFAYKAVYDGLCGSAHNGSYVELPKDLLCDQGLVSNQQTLDKQFLWTCEGAGGGKSSSCQATRRTELKPKDGRCGPSDGMTFASTPEDNLCAYGELSDLETGETKYAWRCLGSEGGIDATCEAYVLPAHVIGTTVFCKTVARKNGSVLPSKSFIKEICDVTKIGGLQTKSCGDGWVTVNNLRFDDLPDSCVKISNRLIGEEDGYEPPRGTTLQCNRVKVAASTPPPVCVMKKEGTQLEKCADGWIPFDCNGESSNDCCMRVEEVSNPSPFKLGDVIYCKQLIAHNNKIAPPAPCEVTKGANGVHKFSKCASGWSAEACFGSDKNANNCCVKTSP
jgi:hypothetical protein